MTTRKIQVLERFGFARRVTNIAQSVFDRNKQPEAQWATVVARGNEGRPTVAIDGGETVTCHSWAAEAYEGNRVTVEVRNHKAYLLTNESRPATDDALASDAMEAVEALNESTVPSLRSAIRAAKEAADEAQQTADATGQYFFHDSNGAHVTTTPNTATGAFNSLWNSSGLLFRALSYNLVSLTHSALSFFDGQGNNDSNIVALFGKAMARVGKLSGGNVVMSADGYVDVNNGDSNLAHFGDVARIGSEDAWHTVVDADRVKFNSRSQTEAVITSERFQFLPDSTYGEAYFEGMGAGSSTQAADIGVFASHKLTDSTLASPSLFGQVRLALDPTAKVGQASAPECQLLMSTKSGNEKAYIRMIANQMHGSAGTIELYGDTTITGGMRATGTISASSFSSSTPLFKVVTAKTDKFSLNAGKGTSGNCSFDVPNGYTFIGVVGFNSAHNQAGTVGAVYKQSASSFHYAATNRSGSDWDDMTVTAYCLCVLSGLVG
ncbi:MAG: hypothetical protein IJ087_14040 [Eggerthellaceae bacterium]|nr:hypothetical protein [Eggerthellaceae bacterium]